MGRRKLNVLEKHERINAIKELKKSKLTYIPDNNGLLLSEIKTEFQGILNKQKRGRKNIDKSINESQLNNNNQQLQNNLLTDISNINNNINFNINPNNSNTLSSYQPSDKHLNKINLPWVDKYRPNNFNDIMIDPFFKNKLNNLIKLNNIPNIIITGPSGTGKTSTIYCIAKYIFKNDPENLLLELNASDNRGIEIINNSIIHFCKKKVDNKKVIIFDEADNITNKAQNILINLMDKYNHNTIFCFTCNDFSKLIESIQSRCMILHYKYLSKEYIKQKIEYICNKENITYDNSGINALIFISQGDMRFAINNLEAVYNSYDILTEDNVYKLCYQPHPKAIITIIQSCVLKNFNLAVKNFNNLKEQGYCNTDISQTMINILKIIDINENIRINYIKIISDIYLNIIDGIDTNIQMYCCIARLIKFII
jgi:replication factor C subunit 2/4